MISMHCFCTFNEWLATCLVEPHDKSYHITHVLCYLERHNSYRLHQLELVASTTCYIMLVHTSCFELPAYCQERSQEELGFL